MMKPDRNTVGVRLQFLREPLCRCEPCGPIGIVRRVAPAIEPGQAVLGDGDRVVLPSDVTAIVEQRDSRAIEWAGICCLALEAHEVLAPAAKRRLVDLGPLVPEGQRARGRSSVDARDPGEILQATEDQAAPADSFA